MVDLAVVAFEIATGIAVLDIAFTAADDHRSL